MKQAAFNDGMTDTPETQGIKYTGSKRALVPYILNLSKKIAGSGKAMPVFDGFSGSSRVSQAYAKTGYQVYANDHAVYTQVFNTAFLLNTRDPARYQPLMDHLNGLKPLDGWFTEHYGGHAEEPSSPHKRLKKPWQQKNTRKLDAIRAEIDALGLDELTKAVAITGLILALDRVDSTLGHYASYLNAWSPRSYKDMKLEVPRLWINETQNTVMRDDVFSALERVPDNTAIAYFDPPYGSNNEKMPSSRVRYAAYYHIWTTVCLNDKPALFGKAKRRADTRDSIAGSVFEEFRKNENGAYRAVEALAELIKRTKARYIIVSYSSGARARVRELGETLARYGRILEIAKINHRRNIMAAMKWTAAWVTDSEPEKHTEYLFALEKR